MRKRLSWVFVILLLAALAPQARGQAVEPIAFTVKFPALDKQLAEIEAIVPTDKRDAVELMMPMWTPGLYTIQNYAGKVQEFTATTPDGAALAVEQPKKNHWRVETKGAARLVVNYKLLCTQKGVTGNWVGADNAVFNGAATFITLIDKTPRPHDVKLELPPQWKLSMSGLSAAPDGKPNHYRAPDFDALVDTPIVAGKMSVNEFEVDGSKHFLVHIGDFSQWDGKRAAADMEKIVQENRRMWGFMPFKRYLFLLVAGQGKGGGGLEHMNSTLISMNATAMRTPASYLSWLMLASHEYFHAFNVKRLRPIALGPFDYEKEARTTGLWVAEGLTTYYGELLVARAGLGTPKDFLARLSSHIDSLQKSPGRLLQSLEQSSLQVWSNGFSGVGGNKDKTISYYVKGPVVGFLLDARIRKATDGKQSLDDLMKLAYKRYSGEKGFTAEDFQKTADDVAGVDLKAWFKKALASTEELDYTEALDWFGLQFAPADDPQKAKTWRLEPRPDATDAQKARLQAWLEAVH